MMTGNTQHSDYNVRLTSVSDSWLSRLRRRGQLSRRGQQVPDVDSLRCDGFN